MDFITYKSLVTSLTHGKKLPDAIYLHQCSLGQVDEILADLTLRIASALKIEDGEWNIVKYYKRDYKLALLNYPTFFDYAYPSLHTSFTIDLAKLSLRKASYEKSDNPPILHRKETFLPSNHEAVTLFKSFTEEGERLGLYENSRTIGFKKNWEKLISNKGYFIDEEGHIKPKAETSPEEASSQIAVNGEIDRHKTAIDRNQLSQPMQILAKHNYFDGNWSILDYGCGKGDDLRELEAHGLNISGWDPVHNPEGELSNSDIVNLGFVLNVIEDREERTETLNRAWEYSDKLLVVSVMVAGESVISQFQPYKDGIVTSRNTFQKYYAQSEIRSYIETSLHENAIAVGQGIFLVFKDKLEEQQFLSDRQHIRRDWQQKTQREIKTREPALKKDFIDKHIEIFTDFWETSLELGRIPANSEFEFSEQLRRIAGSHIKAHEALKKHFGDSLFEEAYKSRKQDLLVYFALGLFEKRKPQTKMPDSLKRDIKAFFSSYNAAIDEAKELLFSVGSNEIIFEACNQAYKTLQCGYIQEGHSYTFHKNYLGDLPPELRVYIGCATQLYGDIDDIHLIKAHMRSGKVSLMRYDDWSKDTPMLVERIKIKLRDQDIDFFDYGERFEPSPLIDKYKYM